MKSFVFINLFLKTKKQTFSKIITDFNKINLHSNKEFNNCLFKDKLCYKYKRY